MDLRRKLKRWAPAIFVFTLIIVLSFIWYFSFPPAAWEEKPNYLQMYVGFIAARPMDAFLQLETGSGGALGLTFIPLYIVIVIHIVLYVVEDRKKQQYTIVNKYYLLYLVVLGLFAISFHNASEYYGWYWNPELDAPGYVDTWTHITSPWLLGALVAPFALERHLDWDRKYASSTRWFCIFAALAAIALVWEIVENVEIYYMRANPDSSYFNYPMDSIKDMIMGAGIGTILSCWIYERLVVDLREKV